MYVFSPAHAALHCRVQSHLTQEDDSPQDFLSPQDFEKNNGVVFFFHRPRGAGIRRLTSKQIIQSNQYQEEWLIGHTNSNSN